MSFFAAISLPAFVSLLPAAQAEPGMQSAQPAPAACAADLSLLPLDFVENRGQWPRGPHFVAHRGALAAGFEPHAIRLDLAGPEPLSMSLCFEDAAPGATIAGECERAGRHHFLLGNDAAAWCRDVRAFAGLRYRGLYPGIDLIVREDGDRLEYDLALAPDADLGRVVVRVQGATALELAPDGALLLTSGERTLRQTPPRTFEVLPDGSRRPLECRCYKIDALRFGFVAPGRDAHLPLLVDPGLEWSTFLGGSGREQIHGLALARDGTGDVIVCGETFSIDFPAAGGRGASPLIPFVARINSTGTALVYATVFGGVSGNVAFAFGLAVDAASAPVVVGTTNSLDFPTTPGALAPTFHAPSFPANREWDAFVTRFDASGSQFVFSTFLGAAPLADATRPGGERGGAEEAHAVAVDAAGAVVVAGWTSSEDFPTTAGALDRTLATITVAVDIGTVESRIDAFVARLDPTGSQLLYSTYLGGQSDDLVRDLAIDAQGVVTLVGIEAPIETFDLQGNRTDHGVPFPTTPDAIRRTHLGASDLFVARLRLDGAGAADLKYATILGGNYIDEARGLALDPNDPELATLCGDTRSWDFPTTPGAWSRAPLFLADGVPYYAGVLARFRFPATGGGTLLWSTLIEGTVGGQVAHDVAIDAGGDVLVVGSDDGGLPTTERSFRRLPANGIFVSRFRSDGQQLLYSTLLHGPSSILSDTLRVVSAGPHVAIVCGQTLQPTFPTTPGAFDRIFGGNGTSDLFDSYDGFVARLSLEPNATTDVVAAAPALLAPADGAVIPMTGVLQLDWSDVTDPSGVQAYQVAVSANPDFLTGFGSAPGAGVYQASQSPPLTPVSDGVFFWRVRTLDGANNFSPWSPVRKFTLGAPVWTNFAAASLTPNGVQGGSSVLGKVLIQNVAPAAGQVYTLTSSNPAVATVPASVTIPAGGNSATFPVSTSLVAVSTPVMITVWSEGNGDHPVLWVDPPTPGVLALTSLTLTPASVTGGAPAQGTVTLNGAAPANGVLVTLGSGSPAASVPPSVLIPAGAAGASFAVATSPVTAATAAAITASFGSGSRVANLSVLPPTAPPTPTAPSLQSPAIDATPAQPVTFDWSDVAAAATYQIQVDDDSNFTAPLVRSDTTSVSQTTMLGLPAVRQWWRVRAVNSAGVAGPFSSARRFQPQAALAAVAPAALTLAPTSVVGGNGATGTVTLTSAAPSGGLVLALSSSNSAVANVGASVTVAAGALSATFAVTTTAVATSTPVAISAVQNGVTRTATLTVTPVQSTPPPAPALVSPAADARFAPGQAISFDWSDVTGAASYTIQIDDTDTFNTPLTVNQTTAVSAFTTSTLPTIRMWWRARANSPGGAAGAWSSARRFEVR